MLHQNVLSQIKRIQLSSFLPSNIISLVVLSLILFFTNINIYAAQVTLVWTPNSESDLAGYKLYYGNSSGSYDSNIDVGNQTSYTVTGLVEGETNYFALTAYDTSNNESAFSSELIYNVPGTTNVAPLLDPITDITVNEGDTITINPTATDADGDTLTFSYSGWVTSNSYTTNNTDSGIHTVTVTVSDGTSTDSQVVTVTVNNTNQAPVLATISSIIVNEGVTITLSPTATDPDGDTLTFSYSGWMTSNSYTTNYTDAGTHTATVTVSDGILTDTQDVSITVLNTNTNQAPVLDPITDITVNEGATLTLSHTATDADGDALTYTYSGWMSSASYTTTYDDAGIHTVTVTVSDDSLSDSQVVTITVVEKDKKPLEIGNLTVASDQTYEIVKNGLQNGAVVYIDRNYAYSTVPTWLQGITYIKTANNDKQSSAASFLTFDVNQDVIVYVAYDNRNTTKPSWLESFDDAGDDLVTTDSTLSLFTYNFSAGKITLGGNEDVDGFSMYTVVIVGQGNVVDTVPPASPQGLAITLQ